MSDRSLALQKKFSNLYDYKFIEKINDETELFKLIKKKHVISKKDKVKLNMKIG